ncbi:MAG: UDP-N-acetylmuramoyl-L-alanine--D-glutamate ligase [Flavobacteriaceae bacterium]|nr:UDP-N-acetylmuramoyl-L-alanine--D-glutamate ligase [Flavobacteriaceae bacterium]
MNKIAILGAGESGVGTAILAKKQGYTVFISDNGKIAEKYKKVLLHISDNCSDNDFQFEEGKHSEDKILQATIVIKSPGIPDTVSILKKIKKAGILVISEIEFASKFTSAVIIGITGTNGKTTTTMLLSHILNKSKIKNENRTFKSIGTAGNIGNSFASQVAYEKHDLFVLELSSFQLDGIINFAPHIAILLNISPDHLDRYKFKFKNYVNSKFKITKNQTAIDYLIYDADDKTIQKWLKKNKTKAKLLPFTLGKKEDLINSMLFLQKQENKQKESNIEGAYIKDHKIIVELNQNIFSMKITNLALLGKHNLKNAMAATMATQLLKVRKETIRQSLSDFEGVEHRLENVLKINGVQYINDSKATNINATYYALESIKSSTVWIVGGVDKGNDYDELLPLVNEKVRAIICLGENNEKIKQTFSNVIDIIVETKAAEEAVKVAYKLSEKGDVVLLSPACASFDLFENYEDRGRQFKNAVRQL